MAFRVHSVSSALSYRQHDLFLGAGIRGRRDARAPDRERKLPTCLVVAGIQLVRDVLANSRIPGRRESFLEGSSLGLLVGVDGAGGRALLLQGDLGRLLALGRLLSGLDVVDGGLAVAAEEEDGRAAADVRDDHLLAGVDHLGLAVVVHVQRPRVCGFVIAAQGAARQESLAAGAFGRGGGGFCPDLHGRGEASTRKQKGVPSQLQFCFLDNTGTTLETTSRLV